LVDACTKEMGMKKEDERLVKIAGMERRLE
jgi:hypothetical protein